MGLIYNKYLEGEKIYGCKRCHTHLAVPEDLMSKVLSFPFSSPCSCCFSAPRQREIAGEVRASSGSESQ